ncbi:ribosomal protein S18-alanine N-acetyltransferase [Sulfurimonas sp.]|uniref:ribosomal protein S18-alanine N-acetyltransferase n=1 Tax=Sulfurimonas sp. TaxID=2022749 RepID=UPI003D10EC7D
MRIRRALSSDVRQLYLLEKKLFSEENFPLSKGSFRYHIKNSSLFVMQEGYDIVAYVLVLIKRKDAKLYSIGVDDSWRGQKIANRLLQKSIEELRKLGFVTLLLEVRVDNLEALALYQKIGFEIQKRLKAFYGDGCDAYLMRLDIKKEGIV